MDKGIIKVLWIEDESDTGMVDRRNYIELIGKYDLTVVKNATDAENLIFRESFDVIIIDVRIPPGFQYSWEDEYTSKKNQRLGALLIKKIKERQPILLTSIGVFTIERFEDIDTLMGKALNKEHYSYKGDSEIPEMFDDFIQKIFQLSKSGKIAS